MIDFDFGDDVDEWSDARARGDAANAKWCDATGCGENVDARARGDDQGEREHRR